MGWRRPLEAAGAGLRGPALICVDPSLACHPYHPLMVVLEKHAADGHYRDEEPQVMRRKHH